MCTIFLNAQDIKIKNPSTFYAPSNDELNNLELKNIVKVCTGGERFWATINKIEGDIIYAIVDNDLVCTDKHGLKLGDSIKFIKANIYQIYE